jgi:hypothetical protein
VSALGTRRLSRMCARVRLSCFPLLAASLSVGPPLAVAASHTTLLASAGGWPAPRPQDGPECWSARGAGVRPPPFPPPVEAAQTEVTETLQRSPRLLAVPRPRWWQAFVRQAMRLAGGGLPEDALADPAPLGAPRPARASLWAFAGRGGRRESTADPDDHLVQPSRSEAARAARRRRTDLLSSPHAGSG